MPVIQCKSRDFSCKNDDRHTRREKDSNAHIAHFRVNINISSFVAGYPGCATSFMVKKNHQCFNVKRMEFSRGRKTGGVGKNSLESRIVVSLMET